MSPPAPRHWLNTLFIAAVHLVAVAGTVAYLSIKGAPSLGIILVSLTWVAGTIFALSAGYHRLFSHRSYEASWPLRLGLLIFGAASCQNSAITWAADHRRHHRRTDSDEDPYDARRGFWWAHLGWVLRKTPEATALHPVPDLERDPLVSWQHRRIFWIGFIAGFVVPGLIGLALGDLWGGFLFPGVVRLVTVWHITFSVNSFAHLLGRQPYSLRNTSRDSPIVALLSMGEGYHNFHHTFPNDYRNGVRAHHFDPSKWGIRLFALVGLARNLRRTPSPGIARARLRVEELKARNASLPDATTLRRKLEERLAAWQALLSRHDTEAATRRDRDVLRSLRAELTAAERAFRETYRAWRRLATARA